ncbi:hypothetical protein KKD84_05490, partial [Patescibacteria group bacterium]|nr:hypothetical protein [Patescibacteria group bacterium]
MNNLVSRLRQTYPVFEYLSSSWELKAHTLHASWQMKAGNIKYRPQLTIPIPNLVNQDPRVLDKLIFQLGLAEIPSY